MIASWLGQKAVVERLLEEGGDINARSDQYGPILNIAAIRRDGDITKMLLDKNAKAYIGTKEYNILQMKKSDLEEKAEEAARRAAARAARTEAEARVRAAKVRAEKIRVARVARVEVKRYARKEEEEERRAMMRYYAARRVSEHDQPRFCDQVIPNLPLVACCSKK